MMRATTSVVPPGAEPLLRPLTRWLAERGRAVSAPDFGLAIGALIVLAVVTAWRWRWLMDFCPVKPSLLGPP